MLTDGALKFLKPLKHDPNAERLVCMIPMGGIYWADEIPDFRALIEMPEVDRNSVYRLFSIRFRLWNGETLDADDRAYWESAAALVPDYPVFRRAHISGEDRAAQESAEKECLEGFEILLLLPAR